MKHNFVPKPGTDLFADLCRFSEGVYSIYKEAIDAYHLTDSVDSKIRNPYHPEEIENLLYLKCWIDTIQWHVEDEIRKPDIDPFKALDLKRWIDSLNQERTNKVEIIDNFILMGFSNVQVRPEAKTNTESPAWALDRLSILALKIYHMDAETRRNNAMDEHIQRCKNKLDILLEQKKDIMQSINELLQDISDGHKKMRVYRQMKMYNDPSLNPVLYNNSRQNII